MARHSGGRRDRGHRPREYRRGPKRRSEIGIERILEGLNDEFGRYIGIGEPLGETMAQGLFEALVIENCAENEAAKARLGFGDRLGLLAHAVPHGIELLDGLNLGRLTRHDGLHGRWGRIEYQLLRWGVIKRIEVSTTLPHWRS
jgi:hypothetical protein